MEFSGLLFVCGMLPLIILGYFLIPDMAGKNKYLIAVSLILIGLSQIIYLPLIVGITYLTYRMSLKIRRGKMATVIVPAAFNLGSLLVLKYLDPILVQFGLFADKGGLLVGFASEAIYRINGLGMNLNIPESVAPLGFSFYILSSLSYILDVYKGKYPAEKKFGNLLLYFVMFSKYFQGPLVRYDQIRGQILPRRVSFHRCLEGAARFATGLGKKAILADYCGVYLLELASSKSDQALVGSWIAAILFFFRIYFDFTGCCDMANGLANIFGFRFPENFKKPYMAISVTEFWERWNITLRGFFVDYVHAPLAGEKKDGLRGFLALLVAVLLYSLWHGATFNFVIFGLYSLIILLIEKKFQYFLFDLPDWLRHIQTKLCIIVGWVIFRFTDMGTLAGAVKAMIGEGGFSVVDDGARFWSVLPLFAVCSIGVSRLPDKMRRFWRTFCGIGNRERGSDRMELLYLLSCFAYILLILRLFVMVRINVPVQPSVFLNL